MPHKVTTIELVDEVTPTARVAGAANAVLRRDDGTLVGDQFDGAGFVRGVERKGFPLQGKKVLVVGNGGVGSPIAASLAAAGVASMTLFDPERRRVRGARPSGCRRPTPTWRCDRLEGPGRARHHRQRHPLGMNDDDPLPMDVDRIDPGTFVGEVVMKQEITPFLRRRGQGLPDPGRQGHAVRDDPRLPGVLRLRHRHARGAAGGRQGRRVTDLPQCRPGRDRCAVWTW
jgi:shikimate dehydrogenase